MRVCIPVTVGGEVDPRWGRAQRLAVAELEGGEVKSWEEIEVNWDELHDASSEARHHANVARLLRDKSVEVVVASHMGQGMLAMLEKMKIEVRLGATGDARQAVAALAL